jgi:GNAT superfamily N-acetyltransferase
MTARAPFPTIESMGDRLGPAIEGQLETLFRALLRGPGATLEPGFCRIVTGEPHPLGNFAVLSDPTDGEQVRCAIEPLCGLEAPSAAIFPSGVSDEVRALVAEHGFALAESMPAMAVDLDGLARPDLPADHQFVEIDAASDGDAWDEALATGYGLPLPVATLFGPGAPLRGFAGSAARYYAVVKHGEMVATSMLFLEGGIAGIYCVATLPEHRGRGLGAFATAEPLHRVRAEGYRTGILQSSAMGESVYRRLGFEAHGLMSLYAKSPAPPAGV